MRGITVLFFVQHKKKSNTNIVVREALSNKGTSRKFFNASMKNNNNHYYFFLLTVVLICIVIMFITCQSLKIIPDVYEAVFCNHDENVCNSTTGNKKIYFLKNATLYRIKYCQHN